MFAVTFELYSSFLPNRKAAELFILSRYTSKRQVYTTWECVLEYHRGEKPSWQQFVKSGGNSRPIVKWQSGQVQYICHRKLKKFVVSSSQATARVDSVWHDPGSRLIYKLKFPWCDISVNIFPPFQTLQVDLSTAFCEGFFIFPMKYVWNSNLHIFPIMHHLGRQKIAAFDRDLSPRATSGQHWLLKQFCLNHPVEHIQKPKLPKIICQGRDFNHLFYYS